MKILSILYKKHKETAHNFFWRNLQISFKGSTILFIYFIAAKLMSPKNFGQFNYIIALLSLLTIFCDFGISASTSKFVAQCKTSSPGKIQHILSSATSVILLIAGTLSLIIILLGKTIASYKWSLILFSLPYLFVVPLASIADGFYRGLKDFRRLSIISCIAGLFSIIISFFLISKWQINGALLSINFFYFLLAAALYLFQKGTKLSFKTKIIKSIYSYGFLIGLANIAFFMYTKVDILILKQFGYITEIGYYGIIEKIFTVFYIPAVILGQTIAPNITRYATLKDYSSIKIKFISSLLPLISIAILFSIAMHFLLPLILHSILPVYYTKAFLLILQILLLLLPVKIWGAYCVNGFITPGGFIKIITIWTFIGGLLNIAFDYLLIRKMGFIGVFWATLIVHSSTIALSSFIFYNKLRRLSNSHHNT